MKYKVPSPSEIRKSYQKSDNFISHHIHRRISCYLTWFFLHFTIHAELIALLTPIVDLLTVFSILKGNFITAAILTQVHLIIDSTDGEIARFRKTIVKRSRKQEAFGAFTDSIVGLLVFPFVIFFAGLTFGSLTTGLVGMSVFYLLVLFSVYSKIYYPDSKMGENFRKKHFGKRKYKIGFSSVIQKSLITFTILFQSIIFLWIFIIGSLSVILLRLHLLGSQK